MDCRRSSRAPAAPEAGRAPARISRHRRRAPRLRRDEGCQHDLLEPRPGLADRLKRPHQRVCGADFVVPVGPDQQQAPYLRVRGEVRDQVERRCIQPCRSSRNRASGCSFRANTPRKRLKTIWKRFLRLLRRQVRDRRLLSDHEFQLRNEVHDELTVRAQHFAQGAPPLAKLRLALTQNLAHKVLEGLAQGGEWNVTLVLVELAGREEAAWRDEHLVQLVHHRGFADTGISRYEHELVVPWATTRSKAASRVWISRSRPYSRSGIHEPVR